VKKPKVLLDSCVALAVAARLRADGYDVVTVPDRGADPGDAAIIKLAASDARAIVTIDTDFGALVFRDGAKRTGVLRLRQRSAAPLADRASELVKAHGEALARGAFVTDDGATVRVSPQAPPPLIRLGAARRSFSHKGRRTSCASAITHRAASALSPRG
jgi:predicted nuclease of predicted toxin-antitoxin system